MGTFLEPSDLTPFADIDEAKAEAMIEDSEAQAMLAAPCLGDTPSLGAVSVAVATGILTVSASTPLNVGDPVQLGVMTDGEPLVSGVTYFVASTPSVTTLTLAATPGGPAIVTTTAGSSTSIKRGLTDIQVTAVRSILRGAILRWNEAGTGIRQSITTGPFGETTDTTQTRKGMFWPSEITSLQGVCSNGDSGKAFSVDTVGCGTVHAQICALVFGAAYCSCGADIAGFPLYEVDA